MKYIGSKNRISKYIAPIIQSYIDDMGDACNGYWEPFVGGANMIDKIKCKNRYGSDAHRYLIALLRHVKCTTDDLTKTITKEEYDKVRENKDDYPDWYVGLVGFCASYDGKWFGGYANNVKTKDGGIRNYTDEAIRSIKKQALNFKEIEFICRTFLEYSTDINNFVVYCDPPYRGTTKYATDDFDYDEFYSWCKQLAKHNIVLISEYWMPEGFECIWESKVKCTLDKASKTDKGGKKLYRCIAND